MLDRVPSHAGITVPLMDDRKLLMRLARGAVTNVAFADLCNLAGALGFELRRVSGSHHIFAHPDIPQLIISNRCVDKPSHTRFASS
jgi:predicted RNA binding protein YcfA (HicA-like mRNA interferase family)